MSSQNEQAVEQEIQAKGLTAPRITPADVDNEIVREDYLLVAGTTTTICALELRNGTIVTGESACVSRENFNAEMGQTIAYNKAREKIWPLLGFRLRDQMMPNLPVNLRAAGMLLQDACHGLAVETGWWIDLTTGEDMRGKRNVGELLCLVHSEISEAMEAHRKNLKDDKLPHRTGLEVELADAVIRIFDLAGGYDLDLGGAIVEKLAFNASRADHKLENRRAEGGKAY